MPAALHKRRGPAAGGTEARLKSENENEAPHSYPTFQQEFNRRRQIVPGSARREAALFAKALYEDFEDCRGRIVTITRGQARPEFVTAERMPWRVQDYAGADDVYLRLNPQGAGQRSIYVDLDYYKRPEWAGHDARDVLTRVLEELDARGIPDPGLAVATGRGLQLVWLTSRGSPKRARKTMQTLHKALESFGPDPRCIDLSRIFRLPGTRNSKSGTLARLLVHDPHRHAFDELLVAILGPLRPRKPRPTCEDPDGQPGTASGPSSPLQRARQRRPFNPQDRIRDLEIIATRLWKGRVPEGHRNYVAHLAATCFVRLPGLLPGDVLDNVRAWCRKWAPDHDDGEIARTVKKALEKPYKYRGSTIAAKLGLDPERAASLRLSTIYCGEARDSRNRNRLKAAKRRKKQGARPHSESAARTEPWKARGIGRTKYYELKRTNSDRTARTDSYPLYTSPPAPRPPLAAPTFHGNRFDREPVGPAIPLSTQSVSPQPGNRVEDDDDDGEIDSEVIFSLRFLVLREGKKAIPVLKEVWKLLREIRKDAA